MRNLHKEITDKILAQMAQGVVPWRKPWTGQTGSGLPRNATTQRAYSGINTVILWMVGNDKGYAQNDWLTFKQANEKGGTVRKGEKGETVIYVNSIEKIDEETGKKVRIPFLKSYTVFNVAQCDGLNLETVKPIEINPDQRNADADAFMTATRADIRHGESRAYYAQEPRDFIMLPDFVTFGSADEYYSTAFHELTHWTGSKSRLDRQFGRRFGDDSYAAEELVAELGAAFCCAEFGFNNEANTACGTLQNSAAYLDHWSQVLGRNDRLIVEAAAKASRAVDYMRDTVNATQQPIAA